VTAPRGRCVGDVTPGMWVRSWRGWRLVEQVTTDQIGMTTETSSTCDHNPECDRHTALTKLGKVRQHGSADKKAWPPVPCAGVGQQPKEN
jgi:hypothetical protein